MSHLDTIFHFDGEGKVKDFTTTLRFLFSQCEKDSISYIFQAVYIAKYIGSDTSRISPTTFAEVLREIKAEAAIHPEYSEVYLNIIDASMRMAGNTPHIFGLPTDNSTEGSDEVNPY